MTNPHEVTENTIKLRLADGKFLRIEAGEDYRYGGSIHIDDSAGNEIVMWDKQEWIDEPESVVGAMGASAATPTQELLSQLGRTEIVDGCWQ